MTTPLMGIEAIDRLLRKLSQGSRFAATRRRVSANFAAQVCSFASHFGLHRLRKRYSIVFSVLTQQGEPEKRPSRKTWSFFNDVFRLRNVKCAIHEKCTACVKCAAIYAARFNNQRNTSLHSDRREQLRYAKHNFTFAKQTLHKQSKENILYFGLCKLCLDFCFLLTFFIKTYHSRISGVIPSLEGGIPSDGMIEL